MNDADLLNQGRPGRHFLVVLGLGLSLALGALLLAGGPQAGFGPAQAAAGLLPPWLWETVTTLGDERVLLALMLPFCLRYPRVFWAVVVASLLAALACRGFKVWLPMPRPAAVLGADQITVIGACLGRHSFPSGHTAAAFACAAVWAARLGWRRALPLLGLAALAGFSRVAVGAHWPVDVLAGAGLGCVSAWLGLGIARHFRWGLRAGVHWGLVLVAAVAVATLPFDGQGYPGSWPWRVAVCLWGLAAFGRDYLRPLLRDGWPVARRPIALVWLSATKA